MASQTKDCPVSTEKIQQGNEKKSAEILSDLEDSQDFVIPAFPTYDPIQTEVKTEVDCKKERLEVEVPQNIESSTETPAPCLSPKKGGILKSNSREGDLKNAPKVDFVERVEVESAEVLSFDSWPSEQDEEERQNEFGESLELKSPDFGQSQQVEEELIEPPSHHQPPPVVQPIWNGVPYEAVEKIREFGVTRPMDLSSIWDGKVHSEDKEMGRFY